MNRLLRYERIEGERIIHFWRVTLKLSYSKAPSTSDPALREWLPLKGIAAGRRCFFLATGPSVNEQDLTKLADEDCFSISNFFLHKDINLIKPRLHFFAPYHEPLDLRNIIDWWRMADSKLPLETDIVMGLSDRDKVLDYKIFPKRKVYYLALGSEEIKTDLTNFVTSPQTGPIMMFPVADWFGYNEINLIGCDMNRLADYGKNRRNFYHDDPRKNATTADGWLDIIYELKCELKALTQFRNFNDYFLKKNVKIYNLSHDSWLTFIEKKFNTI